MLPDCLPCSGSRKKTVRFNETVELFNKNGQSSAEKIRNETYKFVIWYRLPGEPVAGSLPRPRTCSIEELTKLPEEAGGAKEIKIYEDSYQCQSSRATKHPGIRLTFDSSDSIENEAVGRVDYNLSPDEFTIEHSPMPLITKNHEELDQNNSDEWPRFDLESISADDQLDASPYPVQIRDDSFAFDEYLLETSQRAWEQSQKAVKQSKMALEISRTALEQSKQALDIINKMIQTKYGSESSRSSMKAIEDSNELSDENNESNLDTEDSGGEAESNHMEDELELTSIYSVSSCSLLNLSDSSVLPSEFSQDSLEPSRGK